MRLFSHKPIMLLILFMVGSCSLPFGNNDNTVQWIPEMSSGDMKTIELGNFREKRIPITVWRKGIYRTTITIEGICSRMNAFELFIGSNSNKNNRIEIEAEEIGLHMERNGVGKCECKMGMKKVVVTLFMDKSGKLERYIWSDFAGPDIYKNGMTNEIMSASDWNTMYLKACDDVKDGKATIQMFKSKADE